MDKKFDVFGDLIDGAEAAAILGISQDNLRQRVHRGLIPREAMYRAGTLVAYVRSEIERLAGERKLSPAEQRARRLLRRTIDATVKDLDQIRDAIDATANIEGLTRKARKVAERAARQLEK